MMASNDGGDGGPPEVGGAGPARPRWTSVLPQGPRRSAPFVIGVLQGEGVGPEVVPAALEVLGAVERECGLRFDVRDGGDVGAPGRTGGGLGASVAAFCDDIFAAGGALFCGPAGGRFVYELRARFDLFCKLVPLRPRPELADAAVIRPDLLRDVDILLVRENVGGLYMGEFGRRDGGRVAFQHCVYTREQVARIVAVAADLARLRDGQVTVVVKRGGVPAVSELWVEEARAVEAAGGVRVEILDVDNAGFQLVTRPSHFDVVVAPNLFGDVLADSATALLGTRGLSYSANFGPDGRAAYQTGHGAAYDLAGRNEANPLAQILSLALMLRESFGLDDAAERIEDAIGAVLARVRTADMSGAASRVVGTRELTEHVVRELTTVARARAS